MCIIDGNGFKKEEKFSALISVLLRTLASRWEVAKSIKKHSLTYWEYAEKSTFANKRE